MRNRRRRGFLSGFRRDGPFDALAGVVQHGVETVGAFFGEEGAVEGGGEVFVEDFFDFGADARAGLVVVLPILNQDFGDRIARVRPSVRPSAMWRADSAWSFLVNCTSSAK